ncbi:leucine-rich repeat domain-containing protein [uncultured Ruminococcus sp.]|uniref:leucine-rich repeat domain-containing protein n=1 Tax=uncultured Ruminococcus sp. TaxID=165186 RepID=UPI0025E67970|nr:leucine-rich repeat domain-containing protein [uncultured Ruminococcus sp.]
MKKILTASLALVMTFSALSLPLSENDFMTENNLGITADADTYDDYSYDYLNDGTIEITDYHGSSSGIVIPSTFDGKKVTRIKNSAFEDCSNLVSVTIPNSVTTIGCKAFKNCKKLTHVSLPSNLKVIDNYAFYNCSELTSISLPLGLVRIGDYAFCGNYALKKITIPNSISSLGNGAFAYCHGLESISVPYGINRIGTETFAYCINLKNVNLPNSVTIIGESAFTYCFELKGLTLPNNLKSIGNYAFQYCKKLEGITFPDTLTSIGAATFNQCESLKSIVIPNGITSIGNMTFAHCRSLESAYFPDSVTSIGDEVFRLCHSLKNFTIPKSVSSIGDSTFWGCSNLICITIPKSIQTIKESAFDNCRNLEVVYYDGSQSDWDAITIAEKGNSYLSSAAVYTTTIKDISSCIISLPSNTQYFRGTRIRPVITVKDNKRVLTKGTDYTVSYFNNLSAGTATIKVTGKGRYQGTVTKDFVIYRRSIKNCDIKLSSDNYYYNDTEISPSVKVYCNGVEMYSGNYKALYCDNQSAGTATIYITGKNNLRGTVKKTFKINPRNIGNCTVELTKNSLNKYQPTVAVKIGSNSVYSGNYTVKYVTSADKKTVKVTLTGKGNLAGTVTKTYTVA